MSATRYCSVYGCLNNKFSHPELSFFAIPIEEKRCFQWLQLISREDLVGKAAYHYICEVHFDPQDIQLNKTRKLLKKTCLPCYHLPLSAKGHKRQFKTPTQADSWTQVFVNQFNQSTQTPSTFFLRSPYVRKLKSELAACRNRLEVLENRAAAEESELDVFHRLCDSFLSKDFAEQVKAQTDVKSSPESPSGEFTVYVHRVRKKQT